MSPPHPKPDTLPSPEPAEANAVRYVPVVGRVVDGVVERAPVWFELFPPAADDGRQEP